MNEAVRRQHSTLLRGKRSRSTVVSCHSAPRVQVRLTPSPLFSTLQQDDSQSTREGVGGAYPYADNTVETSCLNGKRWCCRSCRLPTAESSAKPSVRTARCNRFLTMSVMACVSRGHMHRKGCQNRGSTRPNWNNQTLSGSVPLDGKEGRHSSQRPEGLQRNHGCDRGTVWFNARY